MLALTTTIAFSAQDCCHACRLTEQVPINGFSLTLSCHTVSQPHELTGRYLMDLHLKVVPAALNLSHLLKPLVLTGHLFCLPKACLPVFPGKAKDTWHQGISRKPAHYSCVAAQNNETVACNAWVFCGVAGGCHNTTTNYSANKNECSLYYASDLDFNVPLDKNVGVMRAPDVTFTSGETSPRFTAQRMFALQCQHSTSRHPRVAELKLWLLANAISL